MSEIIEVSFDAAHGVTKVVHGNQVPHVDGVHMTEDINPYAAHQTFDDEEASVGEDDYEENKVLAIATLHGSPADYPREEEDMSCMTGDIEVR
jgi:hypothetical protein